MDKKMTVYELKKPLGDHEKKFFNMSNTLLHVLRTFIGTDIKPEIHFLQDPSAGKAADEAIQDLRLAVEKLDGLCALVGLLSLIARGYEAASVRESALRTSFFSDTPPEGDLLVLLREAINPYWNDCVVFSSDNDAIPLVDLYKGIEIYPSKFFYEVICIQLGAMFNEYGWREDREVRLSLRFQPSCLVIESLRLNQRGASEVSANDQLFLFHLLLSSLGIGEIVILESEKTISATLNF